MKVRISYTVEVDDDYRKAISHFYGIHTPATRTEVQEWCRDYGRSIEDDIMLEYENCNVCFPDKKQS